MSMMSNAAAIAAAYREPSHPTPSGAFTVWTAPITADVTVDDATIPGVALIYRGCRLAASFAGPVLTLERPRPFLHPYTPPRSYRIAA